MEVRHAHAPGNAGDLRIMPFNRESKRSRPEHTEIVCVMGVLPYILAGEDQVLPERLLQTGMEFIPPARAERSDRVGCTNQKRVQHRIGATRAGENQVLIEWRFQNSCIRSAK